MCVFRKKLGPFFPKKEAQAARFKKRLPTWDNLTCAVKLQRINIIGGKTTQTQRLLYLP